MDEILKTQLLLNSVGADVRHWKKIVSSGINLCQILKDDYERLKITGLTEQSLDLSNFSFIQMTCAF